MAELEKPREPVENAPSGTRRGARRPVGARTRLRVFRRVFRHDANMREVVRLAFSAAGLRAMATGLSLVTAVLVSRLLGADGAGLYFFAVSVVNMTSAFGRAGFGNVLVRHIGESAAKKDWTTGRFVYKTSQRLVGGIAVAIGVVLAASAPWSAGAVFGKPEYEVPLILAGIATVFYSLSSTVGDALRALRRIPSMQLVKTVIPAVATVALLYPLIELWHANGAILAFVLATAITFFVGRRLWARSWGEVSGNGGDSGVANMTVRTLLVSSWALFGVGLANLGMQNIASVLLGALGTNVDVGVFNVANRVANLLLFPLFGVSSILAPKFVQLNSSGDIAALRALTRRSCLFLLIIVVPAAAVIFAIADPVMAIFGSHFENGVTVLRILMIATAIQTGTGPMGILLVMCGREREVWKLSMVALIGAIGMCIAGTIYYGVVGLSWGLVIAISMQNLVQVYLVRKHLGFWPVGRIFRKK